MSKFAYNLQVRKLPNGRWELLAPITYNVPGLPEFTVPAGFDTDFSSVPRLPFMFWILGDKADYAAVAHDYLYRTMLVPRDTADMAFRLIAEMEGELNWFERWAAWAGLRIGGYWSYGTKHEDNQT